MKCKGRITPINFINYFDFLEIVQHQKRSESHLPKISMFKIKVRKIVQNPKYDAIMIIINSLNLLSVFAKDLMSLVGTTKGETITWIVCELLVSAFFFVEMIFLFYCYGIIHAIKRRNHLKFEILFQIVTFSLFIHCIATQHYTEIIKAIEITVILRSLRVLKLFKELRHWKIIMQTISSLVAPFLTLLLVTFIVFLFFSTIGDKAFGGVVNINSEKIFHDSSTPDSYVQMNFNDLY